MRVRAAMFDETLRAGRAAMRRPRSAVRRATLEHALLAIVGLASAAACHGEVRLGCYEPPEGRKIIGDVAVDGAEALSEGDITDHLRTHSDNWSFGAKPLFDPTEVAIDARRIESYYAAEGFFAARVTGHSVEPIDEDAVRVRFEVDEGPPTLVAEVRVEGLDAIHEDGAGSPATLADARARLERVRRALPEIITPKVGDRYSEAAYRAAKVGLRAALRDQGFVHAVVLGEVAVARESRQARVTLLAAPGPLARIREVVIRGAREIPSERISRRVALAPGDVPDREGLEETQRDIMALGAFLSVGTLVVRPSLDEMLAGRPSTWATVRALPFDPELVLEVTVQEMALREVRVGAGLGVDNSRGEVFVLGGFRHRNLFGGLRDFSIELRPLLVVLPSFWQASDFGPAGTARVDFRQPAFIEEFLTLHVGAEYALDSELGYRSHALEGTVGLARTFFGVLSVEGGYVISYHAFFDYAGALDLPLDETLGLSFRPSYLISALRQSLALDLRDDAFDPRLGFFGQIQAEEAISGLGSDFQYIRVLADLRGYVTPWRHLTLAARFKAGQLFLLGSTEAPLTARFQGGGAADFRGFGARTMGPTICRDALAASCSRNDRVYVGGNTTILASFETRWRLPADLGAVAFIDVGQVWPHATDVSPETVEVAVGPGLRYHTPFGPIRADLAFHLTRRDPPGISFHLSIGQAF